MLYNWMRKQSRGQEQGSIANKMRTNRMKIFEDFFYETFKEQLTQGKTIRILDLGGTYSYWESINFQYIDSVEITLVNLTTENIPSGIINICSTKGDATNLNGIKDQAFDFVYSNSCIEHVGTANAHRRMAEEIKRVSKHYYIQTPNYYFPVEPHFLFPMFQFLPVNVRAFLVRRYQLGNMKKADSRQEALQIVDSVHLLTYCELDKLFPNATIKRERFLGFVKSYMVFE